MEQLPLEAAKQIVVTEIKRLQDTYTDAVIRHADDLRLLRRRRLGGGGAGCGGGGVGGGGGGGGGEEAVVGADAAVKQQREAAERGPNRGHRRPMSPLLCGAPPGELGNGGRSAGGDVWCVGSTPPRVA